MIEEEELISDSDLSKLLYNSDEEMDLVKKSIVYDYENYEKRINNTTTEEERIDSEIDNKISNIGKKYYINC